NYAVERLWSLGITVVVAAGNSGSRAGTITKPGDDPFVITVGAANDKGTADPADDNLAEWSSRGPTAADGLTKPDVVAPGRSIISTRAYGSTIEKQNPKALRDPSYIRGSGTSQAAAVVSGSAALLIREKPYLSPAQVKYALMATASPMPGYGANEQGAGRIDVAAAAALTNEGSANRTTQPSNGLGSIEASRGGIHVQTDCNGDGVADTIQGEMTVQCLAWNGTTWTGTTWTGDAWTGTTWTGATWTGATWTGDAWTGTTWTGTTWTGGTWTGGTWTGTTWTGGTWTGTTWTGTTWTGTTWTGGTWNGTTWTGTTWTGTTWTTGQYDEFLTAFWGDRPPHGRHLPGEVSEGERPARPRWA
ncbi:MAG: S8 family serine peptidase, partial [Nocardioidaceae bacterium]